MANSLPERFGKYKVERQLGYGGFGTVYLAHDPILERQVALKVLHAHLAAERDTVKRFEREAKAMAKLKHENIVTIHDLFCEPQPSYIVMEFIEGMNLKEHLRSRKWRLPVQEAIDILRPVAAALDAAHQQGMIHRDVKPTNVLISKEGHVKLTDFGIVKMLQTDDTALTAPGDTLGTHKYMAPEQADEEPNAEIGPASDIYSLAVMSYQMLTGDLSSKGQQIRDALLTHLATSRPDPFKPNLPEDVVAELLKALDKEPKKRHATASSFVKALEQAASSQSVSPSPPIEPTSNPATDQLTNLPTDQSTNSPTDQSTNQRNQPTNSPTHPPTDQLPKLPSIFPSPHTPPPKTDPAKPKQPSSQSWSAWLPVVALLVVGLIVAGLFGYMISRNGGEPDSGSATVVTTSEPATEMVVVPTMTPTPTSTAIPPTNRPTKTAIPPTNTPTKTAIPPTNTPTKTAIPPTNTPTVTLSPTQTPTPTRPPGATRVTSDGMIQVYVPEGEFLMGSEDDDAFDDEKPEHTVYLGAYWIDQMEVTNEMYRACVDAGGCNAPSSTSDYDNPDYSNHPVVYVSWDDATAYCEWAGRRLPTEAEWEKAARGTDGRKYPWGNQPPTTAQANFNSNVGDTTEVGNYPNGASPYGAHDMAGNVWEWVNDWYDENYYEASSRYAPLGPAKRQERVLRGGSWLHVVRDLRTPNRTKGVASDRDNSGGFRCASD